MATPQPAVETPGYSRREFLYLGGMGAMGLSWSEASAQARLATLHRRHVIFILMTGGPSQLETFDPKPQAPASIRGPLRAIETRVPGLWLSESLPRLAERADHFALIRSMQHDAAPIHEAGQQLLMTGRLVERGVRFPHFGAVVAHELPTRPEVSANVILPRTLRLTGTHRDHGQSAGGWAADLHPQELADDGWSTEPESIRRLYGESPFGRLLLQARRQVEHGTRCVTVNLFDTLSERITWDCHGDVHCAPGTIYDYRDTLGPRFDQALAGLIDDLQQRGLWHDTLIVATGEFGRTPKINEHSGRDHWPACWSTLVAGGGVTGGAVIGASDAYAAEPLDRPVHPSELTATLLGWFGIDGRGIEFPIGKETVPLLRTEPLAALWG